MKAKVGKDRGTAKTHLEEFLKVLAKLNEGQIE